MTFVIRRIIFSYHSTLYSLLFQAVYWYSINYVLNKTILLQKPKKGKVPSNKKARGSEIPPTGYTTDSPLLLQESIETISKSFGHPVTVTPRYHFPTVANPDIVALENGLGKSLPHGDPKGSHHKIPLLVIQHMSLDEKEILFVQRLFFGHHLLKLIMDLLASRHVFVIEATDSDVHALEIVGQHAHDLFYPPLNRSKIGLRLGKLLQIDILIPLQQFSQ